MCRPLPVNALGGLLVAKGDPDGAIAIFDGILDVACRSGDIFVESVTLANSESGWLARGEPRPGLLTRYLELSLQLGGENGTGDALEGLAACAAAAGDIERTGLLFDASETARLRTGLVNQQSNRTSRAFVEGVLASDRAAEFEAARECLRE